MPNPSSVTAQNINTEIGNPATAQLDISTDANVKNLISYTTGAIPYGNCRWGINFRGGDFSVVDGAGGFTKMYGSNSYLQLISDTENIGTAAAARANLELNSNGTMVLNCVSGGVTVTSGTTWLTSGVAGDYTANMVFRGSLGTVTGSGTNTALALSTTRSWSVNSSRATLGSDSDYLHANLIITNTSDGVELFRRQVYISSIAIRS